MDLETLKLFAEYNRRTNKLMNGILSGLTEDQWNKEFQGYFPSIRAVCHHIFTADYLWMKRFGSLRKFKVLNSPFFDADLNINSKVFTAFDEYLEKRNTMDQKFLDLTGELSPDDLHKNLGFKTFNGLEQEKRFGGVILHVFNHQTHHRGMISLYLDSMQIENDFSNLLSIL